MAPPMGTQPTAIMASVARRWRGADSALTATTLGMTPPMPSPANSRSQNIWSRLLEYSGKRKYSEPQIRTDQSGLAAIPVAHPPKNRGAKKNTHQARAEYRPKRAWRHAPSPDQVGRGESDRRDVITVDQNDKERPDEQVDLE